LNGDYPKRRNAEFAITLSLRKSVVYPAISYVNHHFAYLQGCLEFMKAIAS